MLILLTLRSTLPKPNSQGEKYREWSQRISWSSFVSVAVGLAPMSARSLTSWSRPAPANESDLIDPTRSSDVDGKD